VAIEVRRRGGELFAEWDSVAREWRYPAWQFDEEGNVRPEVERVLREARESGVRPSKLGVILNRRAGLTGRKTVLDYLREGDDRAVRDAIRAAS
jgi:hypothetical protein